MKAQIDILNSERTQLSRFDLITYEHLLAESIKSILNYSSYSLYFPRKIQSLEAVWDAKEKKLLLPLVMNNKFYGQFVARGVSIRAPKTLMSMLPAVATLALEKVQGMKSSITNAQNGLFTRDYLHHAANRELRMIREGFHLSGEPRTAGSEEYRASVGVVLLDLSGLRSVETEFGHLFAEELAVQFADSLAAVAPEQALVCNSGDYEYAILVPAGTSSACRKIAAEAVRTLRSIQKVHAITEHRVGVDIAAGYAAFPQDFEGAQFELKSDEQSRLLLRKARIGASVAKRLSDSLTIPHVLGFNRLLHEGGTVREVLPVSRVVVDVGMSMGAREGQRFSVWSCSYDSTYANGVPANSLINRHPLYKGELVLMEVREADSIAEIMHMGDPTWAVEPTDAIKLLPEEKGIGVAVEKNEEAEQLDSLTGLYKHRDFIGRFTKEREKTDSFALALIRLSRIPHVQGGAGEQILAEATQQCRDILGSEMIGGRYGLNSLICFYPEGKPEFVQILFNELCERLLTNLGIEAAVGVFCYPYLDYRKGDALECCLKALEYAMLLPAPRVGILDSLALNISADKLYSKNDSFGAIEEYKRALLADEDNTMAWNSLGVCYAGLGRPEEARKHFEGALARDEDDVMALYNLGHISQTIGNFSDARTYYDDCLMHDEKHFFSLIRLGQVNEMESDFATARTFFERARALEENKPLVERNFARLCMKEENPDKAREHLHQALLYNPQDAVALELMARIYLDGGEDPEIAEVLARQAAALRPDFKGAWLQLARALEACGKKQDAHQALVKAGEL